MTNATNPLLPALLVPLVLLAGACSKSPQTPFGQDARISPDAARDSLAADAPRADAAQADRGPALDQPALPDSAGDSTSPDSATDMIPSPDMDPFPVGRFGCMGTVVGGLSQLGQVGNVRVFSGCGGPSEYLLVWGGGVGQPHLRRAERHQVRPQHRAAGDRRGLGPRNIPAAAPPPPTNTASPFMSPPTAPRSGRWPVSWTLSLPARRIVSR